MANGAAALHLVPAPEHLPKDAGSPDKAEATIGEAAASAVTTFCVALQNYQHLGMLDPELREAGGIGVARLVELWLAHGGSDEDFIAVARQAGRAKLRRFLDPEYFQHYTAVQGDAALDFFLDSVFEITNKVVRGERALRMAEAH